MQARGTKEEIFAARAELREEYKNLFDDVSEILFRHDPIGINFEENTDEYEPEAGTILPRLRDCRSQEDVVNVVFEEFNKWFNYSVGPKDKYQLIATEIWRAWATFKDQTR